VLADSTIVLGATGTSARGDTDFVLLFVDSQGRPNSATATKAFCDSTSRPVEMMRFAR
jgi:hypothetical protein